MDKFEMIEKLSAKTGVTYDEAKEGVPFESLPEDWVCPLCKHPKSDFVLQS